MFWIIMFLFSFVSWYFLFPLWFLQWPFGGLVIYFLPPCVCVFHSFFFFLIVDSLAYSLIVLWLEEKLDIISISLHFLRIVLWPSLWSILKSVPCALEKNVFLLLSHWMLYKCELSPSGLKCYLWFIFPYWFSV